MDDENQNCVPGSCPEFGAIFMSNSSTKKECLRRKVFALPSSQSHFVKQVKAGMILFLFEFERKELHGVFQACSDGAINILPHAFRSSGKQFPAQVKFVPLWNCRPLSENEFRDAIRENYYSKYKFNFGLSEDQVQRLLSLFSLKRLKDQGPQKQLTRTNVATPSEYSASKNRRQVDRSPRSNQVPGECDDRATDVGRFGTYMDVEYEQKATAFLNECFQDLKDKFGRNIYAEEYDTNGGVSNKWNTGIEVHPAVSVRSSSGNFGSTPNDARFSKRGRVETNFYDDDGFAPNISTAYPSSSQHKVDTHAYPSKHVLETGSVIDDSTKPFSMFLSSMEMLNSNVNYSRSSKDLFVTTTLPYDADVSDVNYQGASSSRFNQDRALFPLSLETTRTTLNPDDVNFGSGDFIPLSNSPNQYECSNRISLPRDDYLDNLAAEYSKKEWSRDFSPPKPSLATFLSSKIGNNVSISEPSSYRTSPSKFPSLTFSDVRYPTLLQDRHDFKVPEVVHNAELGNAGFMFKESQHLGDSFYNGSRVHDGGISSMYKNVEYVNEESQQLHVHEPRAADYLEITSLSPAAYQHSECFYPDRRKKSSVFSRLAFPSKAHLRERNILPDTADFDMDNSVKEVMDMLHQSQYHWVKAKFDKHNNHAANFRDRKQATSDMISREINVKQKQVTSDMISGEMNVKQKQVTSDMILREMNVNPISFSKEDNSQKTAESTFVDFKRRSAVRKNLEDGKNGNLCGNLNNKSASVTQCKRRKLIRPDLSGKESSERCISGDASQNVIASSAECSVSKFAESVKVSVCHLNQNDTLPNVICQAAGEGNLSGLKSEEFITEGRKQAAVKGNISGSKSEEYSTEGGKQAAVEGNISDSKSEEYFTEGRKQAAVQGNRSDSKSEEYSTEGGKQSIKNQGISSMASVSYREMCVEIEQDLTTREMQVDGELSQHHIDASGSSTQEPTPKNCCEDNDGVSTQEPSP